QRLPLNGRSYDALSEKRWRVSKSDGASLSAMSRLFCSEPLFAAPVLSYELVSVDFDNVYEPASCSPFDNLRSAVPQNPLWGDQPVVAIWRMLPSAAPGRIGLVADSGVYGRTVPPGVVSWLMFTGMRWRSPYEPKYPTMRPVPANSRSTLT